MGKSTSLPSNLMCSANFAGTMPIESLILDSKLYMLTHIDSVICIIDSGASDHMTSNKDLLTNIMSLPIPFFVTFPNCVIYSFSIQLNFCSYVNKIIILYSPA